VNIFLKRLSVSRSNNHSKPTDTTDTARYKWLLCRGIVESTGMTAQMRTSYLPSEILWAHRLAPLLAYQKDNGQYRIDYKRFHAVELITMPECSAKSLAESEMGHGEGDDDDEAGLTAVTLQSACRPPSRSGHTSPVSGRIDVIKRVRGSLRLRRQRSRRVPRDAEHVIVVDDVTSGAGGKPEVDVHRSQNGTQLHNFLQ